MTAPISNEPTTTRLHHYAGRYWRAPEGPQGPGRGTRGRRDLAFLKSRMQFDWVKIQQGLKTLRFQRCEFRA